MQTDVLNKLLYTGRIAGNAKPEKKTEVVLVYQPASGKPYNEPTITVDKDCKLLLNSSIWEALPPEQCTLMIRLLSELRKSSVWYLAHFAEMSVCEMKEKEQLCLKQLKESEMTQNQSQWIIIRVISLGVNLHYLQPTD